VVTPPNTQHHHERIAASAAAACCLQTCEAVAILVEQSMDEGQFILNNIAEQNIKYYLVLNALPESSIALIADLVDGALPEDAYD
jgi:hypothetical protein